MRRCRVNLPERCYHLVSRGAHRAFFLDEDERMRLVDLVRRSDRFFAVLANVGRWVSAMTRQSYCGNLLWQSCPTRSARPFLLPTVLSKAPAVQKML